MLWIDWTWECERKESKMTKACGLSTWKYETAAYSDGAMWEE